MIEFYLNWWEMPVRVSKAHLVRCKCIVKLMLRCFCAVIIPDCGREFVVIKKGYPESNRINNKMIFELPTAFSMAV